MRLPRLYAIVDLDICEREGWAPRDLWQAFLAGGARLLQLRAKSLASGPLLELATSMTDDARQARAVALVNDRADLAVLAGAHGTHVGQDDLPPADVRRVVGPEAVVGLSTHTAAQVTSALISPVSYVAVGPVFGTKTKHTGYRAVGLDLVRHAAAEAGGRLPVVAIGGITLERAPRVIEAGADAVAVITDLITGSPEARVREWVIRLA